MKKQIGIIWSAANLSSSTQWNDFAYELGIKLAESDYTLLYGAEKDMESYSMYAARGALSVNGSVIAVLYGKYDKDYQALASAYIYTGMERWWGREFVFINSCDAVIAIWWWSWTLNELTIAYQSNIPIICITGSWWWADKLAGEYLDERYKTNPSKKQCVGCSSVEEVIEKLINIF